MSNLCSQYSSCTCDDSLETETHVVLSLLERDFPVSLNVIVTHLLHHLPYYIKNYGPVYGYWMYPFEHLNCWISRRVTNRRFPDHESTVVETYRYFEWASFLQMTDAVPEHSVSVLKTCMYASDDGANEMQESANHLTCSILSNDIFESLRELYLAHIPEYNKLYEQYIKDRNKAKIRHQIKKFPSMQQ